MSGRPGQARASSPVSSSFALLPGTRAWRLKRRYKALTRRASSKDAYAPFRRLVLKLALDRGVSLSAKALRELDRALIRARKAPGDAIQLKLRNCGLTSQAICIVFEALASCPAVDKLDLRGNTKGLDSHAMNLAAELMCCQIAALLGGPFTQEKVRHNDFCRRLHGILAESRVERSCCLRRIKFDRNIPGRIRLQQLEALAIRANERLAIRQCFLVGAARHGGLDASLSRCSFDDESSALTAAIEALELCVADPKQIELSGLSSRRGRHKSQPPLGASLAVFETAIYHKLQSIKSLLGPPSPDDLGLLTSILDQFSDHKASRFFNLWPADLDGDRGAASPLNARSESAFDDDDDEMYARGLEHDDAITDDTDPDAIHHEPPKRSSLTPVSIAEVKDDFSDSLDDRHSAASDKDQEENDRLSFDTATPKKDDENQNDSSVVATTPIHNPRLRDLPSVPSVHSGDDSDGTKPPVRLPDMQQVPQRKEHNETKAPFSARSLSRDSSDEDNEVGSSDLRKRPPLARKSGDASERMYSNTSRDARWTPDQFWKKNMPSPELESELGSEDEDVLSPPHHRQEHPMALPPFRLTPKALRHSVDGQRRQAQFEEAADALAASKLEPLADETPSKQLVSNWGATSSLASSCETGALVDLSQRAVTAATLLPDLEASLLASGDHYSRLQRLVLSKNRLRWLPAEAIYRLDCLKVLDVSHNELSSLRPVAISPDAKILHTSINFCGGAHSAASVEQTPRQVLLTSSFSPKNSETSRRLLTTSSTKSAADEKATLPASLVHIEASYNKLRGLGGLEACGRLRVLRVRHNRLRHLGGLEHLNLLQEVDAAYNAIAKASVLRPLSCNTELLSLDVTGCPVDADPARPARPKLVCLLPHLLRLNGEPMPRSAQSQLERRRSIERREKQQIELTDFITGTIAPRAPPEMVRSQRKADAERSDYGKALYSKRRLIAGANNENENSEDPRLLTTKQQVIKARNRKKQGMRNHSCSPSCRRTASEQREAMEALCKECAKPIRAKIPVVDVPRVFGQPWTGPAEPTSRRASEPWTANGAAMNVQGRRRSTSAHRRAGAPPNTVLKAQAPRRKLNRRKVVAKIPPDQFESWLEELLRVLTAAKGAVEVLEKLKERRPALCSKFRGFRQDNEGIQDINSDENLMIFSEDLVHPFRQSLADVESFAKRPPPESALEACISAPSQLKFAALAWNDARRLSEELRELLSSLFPETMSDDDDHTDNPKAAKRTVSPSKTKGGKPAKSSQSTKNRSDSTVVALGSAFKEEDEIEIDDADPKHPLANFAERLELEISKIKTEGRIQPEIALSDDDVDSEYIEASVQQELITMKSNVLPSSASESVKHSPRKETVRIPTQDPSRDTESPLDQPSIEDEPSPASARKRPAVRDIFQKFRSGGPSAVTAPASDGGSRLDRSNSSVDYTLVPLSLNEDNQPESVRKRTDQDSLDATSSPDSPLSHDSALIGDLKNVKDAPSKTKTESVSEASRDEDDDDDLDDSSEDYTSGSPIWRQGYDESHKKFFYFNDETGESIWVKPPNNAPFLPYDPDASSGEE